MLKSQGFYAKNSKIINNRQFNNFVYPVNVVFFLLDFT